MGVNITTIDYLRVLIIEIGSTIILTHPSLILCDLSCHFSWWNEAKGLYLAIPIMIFF